MNPPDALEESEMQRLQRLLGAAIVKLDRWDDAGLAVADAVDYFPHGDGRRETHVLIPIPEINKLLRVVHNK